MIFNSSDPFYCFFSQVVENFIVRHGWVGSEPTLERHLINTLIIVGIALGVSMSTECLGLVLILNVSMSFIFLALSIALVNIYNHSILRSVNSYFSNLGV